MSSYYGGRERHPKDVERIAELEAENKRLNAEINIKAEWNMWYFEQLAALEGRSSVDHIRYQGELETKVVNLTNHLADKTDEWRFEMARHHKVNEELAALREAAQGMADAMGRGEDRELVALGKLEAALQEKGDE